MSQQRYYMYLQDYEIGFNLSIISKKINHTSKCMKSILVLLLLDQLDKENSWSHQQEK
jgi:hypothetical protein